MKLGIMQPYFFPYIGYFQLINEVDTYVNLDHVSFMKRSFMVRNTLRNNITINIPVSNGSQNKTCIEVMALSDENWFDKFFKTLNLLYGKEANYQVIMDSVILPWKKSIIEFNRNVSISEFNFTSIYQICKYLDVDRRFYSSVGITDKKRNEGLQEITKHFGGNVYVNAIGGQSLYSKEDFKSKGIDLKFIKMGHVQVENPYISILDLLFRYDKEHIKTELKNYTLI